MAVNFKCECGTGFYEATVNAAWMFSLARMRKQTIHELLFAASGSSKQYMETNVLTAHTVNKATALSGKKVIQKNCFYK